MIKLITFDIINGKKIRVGWDENESYEKMYVNIQPSYNKVLKIEQGKIKVSTCETVSKVMFRRTNRNFQEMDIPNLDKGVYDFFLLGDDGVRKRVIEKKAVGESFEIKKEMVNLSKNSKWVKVIMKSKIYIPSELFWLEFKDKDSSLIRFSEKKIPLVEMQMLPKESVYYTSYIVNEADKDKLSLRFSNIMSDFIKLILI